MLQQWMDAGGTRLRTGEVYVQQWMYISLYHDRLNKSKGTVKFKNKLYGHF